jgi:coatomer protein complex subunit alpha (xenin)
VVFKLERERPPTAIHQNILYYVKGKNIRGLDLSTQKDVPLAGIVRGLPGQYPPPRALSYNPADNSLLMTSDTEGGMYAIHGLPKDLKAAALPVSYNQKKGSGGTALWIARNKFAVFDKATQVRILWGS